MSDDRVRKAVSLLVKLTHSGIDDFVEKYATNVSAGGMFIRTRDPKPVGTTINFKIEIAAGLRVLQGSGTVQWTRGANDPGGPAGMGVKFATLDPASRALVERMVGLNAAPAAAKPIAPVAPPPPPPKPAAPSPMVEPGAYNFDDEPLGFGATDSKKEVDLDLETLLASTPPPPPPAPSAPPEFAAGLDASTLDAMPMESLGSNIFSGIDLEQSAPPAPAATELTGKRAPAAPPPPPPASSPPNPSFQQEFSEDALAALPSIRRGAPQPAQAPRAPQVLRNDPKPEAIRQAAGAPVFIKAPTEAVAETGPIIGIDLGTTNSCVAVLSNGKPRVLRSKDGYNTIPSVVALNQRGVVLVGHRAKAQMVLNPATTIYGAKRLVGRDFDSPTVAMVRERFRYEVVPGADGKAAVSIGQHTLALEEVQGLVLKELKEFAEEYLGAKVARAVVTCPAYYSEQQREAVRRAGVMAGLKVERVLNEPTAAALAYGLLRELSKKVLVYDLGGGTFDATLLRIDKNTFEVLATGGDIFLGGLDFDNLMVDVLLKKFQDMHHVEFNGDPVSLSRITDVAEKAKQSLSEMTTFDVHLPMLQMTADGKPLDLKCTVTREELNAVSQPLVDRTIDVVNDVLLDAKLKAADIDDIILVGGMTRMPLVRKAIEKWFKKPPQASVNADEAVAVGAALYTGTIDKVSSVTLIDVVPMTLGVGVGGGAFKRIIERNSPLPATKSFSVATSRDNEDAIEINVFQGEDSNVTANEYVGTARIEGLPKGRKGDVQVIVSFTLDAECVLRVEAKELKTRKSFSTTLATRYTSDQIRDKLGIKQVKQSVAEQRRAEELQARGGSFWGKLKRVFSWGKK